MLVKKHNFVKKLITILLILVGLKSIVWSLLIPIWHFPDEQAHFGHIANNVEPEYFRATKKADLNEEIAIAEQKLGNFRDEQGNNRFTYHPEYNIEYMNIAHLSLATTNYNNMEHLSDMTVWF